MHYSGVVSACMSLGHGFSARADRFIRRCGSACASGQRQMIVSPQTRALAHASLIRVAPSQSRSWAVNASVPWRPMPFDRIVRQRPVCPHPPNKLAAIRVKRQQRAARILHLLWYYYKQIEFDHGRETSMAHDGRKRKSPEGRTTSNLICSAHIGTSAELSPHIIALHVPPGSTVADVTYGKGIFWKHVPKDAYRVLATDIANGVDCRNLPYHSGSIDCVVLDPPYMEGFFRRATAQMAVAGTYAAFRSTYSSGAPTTAGPKYHAAVLDLYSKAGKESHRVLRPYGTLIVKCQDEVSANV